MVRLAFIFLALFELTAMVGTGTIQEHQKLVYESLNHEAAALIEDKDLCFLQSGVLVRKNIVLTAAHGMQLLLNAKYPMKDMGGYILITPKELYVTFSIDSQTKISYKVETVLLDSRYIRFEVGDQHKYDIAILKLAKDVDAIEPVKIHEEIAFESDVPMQVQTWGNADIPSQKLKRGFYFFEWVLFFPNKDEDPLANLRTVMLSSIFFEPKCNLPEKPNINDSESAQRSYFAVKSWLKHKGLYGLALQGTSGAPVYVEKIVNGKKTLTFFGLVMGYAPVGEENLLTSKNPEELYKNPKRIYGAYQTIITTPFRLNMQPSANTTDKKHFVLDKRYLKMINELSGSEEKAFKKMTKLKVFKIFTPAQWEEFQISGVFAGSDIDKKDGFIHLSLDSQWKSIWGKFFNKREVYLVELHNLDQHKLKIEANKIGGDKYPHYYGGNLTKENIKEVVKIPAA